MKILFLVYHGFEESSGIINIKTLKNREYTTRGIISILCQTGIPSYEVDIFFQE